MKKFWIIPLLGLMISCGSKAEQAPEAEAAPVEEAAAPVEEAAAPVEEAAMEKNTKSKYF